MVKRCLFCGRYYNPDKRVRNPKACFREQCKKARKQLAQSNWCKNNPNYFKGRYWYVKQWRKKHKKKALDRKISDDTRRVLDKSSIYRMILLIPGRFRDRMIQDEILLKRIGRSTFIACGQGK